MSKDYIIRIQLLKWTIAIINAPSADVQEIVRCKDCKYLMFSDCYGECSKGKKGIVMPDDFCSCGERR